MLGWRPGTGKFVYLRPWSREICLLGHADHHHSVQLLLPVGASLPHIHGCDLLPPQDVLDHDGGRPYEVLWEGNHYQVHRGSGREERQISSIFLQKHP